MTAPPLVGVAFGTRSEVVKLAPVVRALEASKVAYRLYSTGQHRALLDQALPFFRLQPHHDLRVMTPEQPLSKLVARITDGMAELLQQESPTLLLVEGGTASALGAALAAYLCRIPVAHVNAGLRSFDKMQPFPEEANRTLIASLAGWHFCATNGARDNLFKQGIDAKRLFVTGGTGVDSVLRAREELADQSSLGMPLPLPELPEKFALVTCHRRENWDKLDNVVAALRDLAQAREDVHFVWPVHPNPIVRRAVLPLAEVPRIHIVDPVGYPTLLRLLEACYLVVSDSGGIQEEAPAFGKPVLLLRYVTDRPELTESGGALLVGTDPKRITAALGRLWEDKSYYERMSGVSSPFGDGQAALRIVRMLTRTHFAPP